MVFIRFEEKHIFTKIKTVQKTVQVDIDFQDYFEDILVNK